MFLLFLAPFLEKFHLSPPAGDYFRFTADGARMLFLEAGYEIVEVQRIGDSLTTSGYLMGFGLGDLTTEQRSKLLQPAEADSCWTLECPNLTLLRYRGKTDN